MPEGMTMGSEEKDKKAYGGAPGRAHVLMAPPAPQTQNRQYANPVMKEDVATGVAAPILVKVASAQGLEPKGRASLDQHLAAATVPAGQPASLTLTLTVVRGHVDKVVVAKATGAADAATVKAIVKALEAWKAPVWVDGTVKLVLDVRS
jgi:hypothetical protein